MFQDQYPHFEKDSVLKASMLANLREYPRDMFSLLYREYSDGIITGGEVVVKQETSGVIANIGLIIRPGIIKYMGKLYYMKEEYFLECEATEINTVIKILFEDTETTSDCTISKAEIILSSDEVEASNEMELGRFLLKEGAKLRQDYQDISDFTTTHNTINRLYVPYAGIGGVTLAPEITYYYGEQLLNNNSTNPYDITFAMQCIQNKQIHRPVITQYLRARLGVKGDIDNEQIHSCFVSIMEEVLRGGGNRNSSMRTGRRVIVE